MPGLGVRSVSGQKGKKEDRTKLPSPAATINPLIPNGLPSHRTASLARRTAWLHIESVRPTAACGAFATISVTRVPFLEGGEGIPPGCFFKCVEVIRNKQVVEK